VIMGWVQIRPDVAAFCAESAIMYLGRGREAAYRSWRSWTVR
jgi:hypothetical protein